MNQGQANLHCIHVQSRSLNDTMGLIRYLCGNISMTMNDSCKILGLRVFLHVEIWRENTEMQKQKFEEVTLRYSIGFTHYSLFYS